MSLDGRVGSLEVGRLADLVVLSDDYFRVPVDEIRTLRSVLTMVGGRVVYGEGGFAELESTASTMAR
jgi:predicted amidohydrolase YtcJ